MKNQEPILTEVADMRVFNLVVDGKTYVIHDAWYHMGYAEETVLYDNKELEDEELVDRILQIFYEAKGKL